MTAKRGAPDDGDVSTTSSRQTSSSNCTNKLPRTRNDYTKDGVTNFLHCRDRIQGLNTRAENIIERLSDLDSRRKSLQDKEKVYQAEEAKHNALHERRTTRQRVYEQLRCSRELVRNKVSADIDCIEPGKPRLASGAFDPLIIGLNGYVEQLDNIDRQNLEAEKEVLDDAELGKMRSDQEQETKALEDEAKGIEEAKGTLWRD